MFIQRTLTRRALITITNELRKPDRMQPPHWASLLERAGGWRGVWEPVNVWGSFLAKRCIHKRFDSVLNSRDSNSPLSRTSATVDFYFMLFLSCPPYSNNPICVIFNSRLYMFNFYSDLSHKYIRGLPFVQHEALRNVNVACFVCKFFCATS